MTRTPEHPRDEHGEPHGTCRGWHPNGTLTYERHYEHGVLKEDGGLLGASPPNSSASPP